VIEYACYKAFRVLRDFEQADRCKSEYEEGLPPRTNFEKTRPGPLTLVNSPGPFDYDVDSHTW
jgi:hypothetical protein